MATGVDFSSLRAYADNIEWLQSERYVLAYILKHPDAIYDIAVMLRPEHFSNSVNRSVYAAMLQLQSVAKIDVVTLVQAVNHPDADFAYFGVLESTHTNSANLNYHINCIRQAYARRLLFKNAVESLERLTNMGPDESVDEILAHEQRRILDVQSVVHNADRVQNIAKYTDIFLSTLQQRAGKPNGVLTGFTHFDRLVGGLIAGRLYVISARSKTGKTALLMNWALNAAVDQQKPILYINTEMTEDDMMPRMLACLSGVPEHEIASGSFVNNLNKELVVHNAASILRNTTFFHTYMPVATIEQIASLARKYKMQHDIQLLVYDYIKDTMPGQHGRLRDDVVLGLITMGLKNIAGELNIPVLSAAQFNRGALNAQDVNEAHIYGSDQITFYSDYIFYMRKIPEQYFRERGIDPNLNGDIVLQAGPTRYRGEYAYILKFDRSIQRIRESNQVWEE